MTGYWTLISQGRVTAVQRKRTKRQIWGRDEKILNEQYVAYTLDWLQSEVFLTSHFLVAEDCWLKATVLGAQVGLSARLWQLCQSLSSAKFYNRACQGTKLQRPTESVLG